MALVLRATGATFTKYFETFYPMVSGLVGLYRFGSANGGLTNLAGGSDLTVIGSPTVNADSFTGGISAGYNTGLPETADYTFVGVAKRISGSALIVGNLNNVTPDASIGSTLGQATNTAILISPSVNANGGVSTSSSGAPVGDVCFFAGRCVGNKIDIFFGHNGSLSSATFTGGSRILDTLQTLKIAAHNYPTLYTATVEPYMAAIHTQGLTDPEITAAYSALQRYYADLGITTL